ncbi:MAG: HAD family hydrolase [Minwuia sp.]|nr:HAD family hydrolase [Minwuia sp.]
MALRAILFDKDGTLIDFDRTWYPVMAMLAAEAAAGDQARAAQLLDAGGYDAAAQRFRAGSVIAAGTIAETVDLWYPDLADDDANPRQAMIDHFNRACVTEGAARAVALPGVGGALADLRAAGYLLGVATNDGAESAIATLRALTLLDCFSLVQGYDSVPRPKPAADQLHRFAAHVGCAPDTVAMVGDNVHDLEMARSGGAGLAVGVLSGTSDRPDLAPLADVVLGSVADLPQYLRRGSTMGPQGRGRG